MLFSIEAESVWEHQNFGPKLILLQFGNLSEFTSVSWQPYFFTFKTILTMADGDPDFINPVCSFVDACFAKKMQSMSSI